MGILRGLAADVDQRLWGCIAKYMKDGTRGRDARIVLNGCVRPLFVPESFKRQTIEDS